MRFYVPSLVVASTHFWLFVYSLGIYVHILGITMRPSL